MSNLTINTDIFFAEFDGRRYAYGLSADDVRDTTESSFRFGTSAEDGALGATWVNSEVESGWRICKENHAVVHLVVEYVGEIGVANHVSWQCPECGQWCSEDVEHDAVGPVLACCSSRHHVDDGLWLIINW